LAPDIASWPVSLKSGFKELGSQLSIRQLPFHHPRSAEYAPRQKAISYVQPLTFDMLAGASPASAMEGWAE